MCLKASDNDEVRNELGVSFQMARRCDCCGVLVKSLHYRKYVTLQPVTLSNQWYYLKGSKDGDRDLRGGCHSLDHQPRIFW